MLYCTHRSLLTSYQSSDQVPSSFLNSPYITLVWFDFAFRFAIKPPPLDNWVRTISHRYNGYKNSLKHLCAVEYQEIWIRVISMFAQGGEGGGWCQEGERKKNVYCGSHVLDRVVSWFLGFSLLRLRCEHSMLDIVWRQEQELVDVVEHNTGISLFRVLWQIMQFLR